MSNGSSTNFYYLSNDLICILKPVGRKSLCPCYHFTPLSPTGWWSKRRRYIAFNCGQKNIPARLEFTKQSNIISKHTPLILILICNIYMYIDLVFQLHPLKLKRSRSRQTIQTRRGMASRCNDNLLISSGLLININTIISLFVCNLIWHPGMVLRSIQMTNAWQWKLK